MKKLYPCHRTYVAPVALLLFALTACSKVNDMHDATMAMNKTTGQMAANTDAMNKKTTELGNTMSDILDTGRQGASLDLRSKHWDLMLKATKLEEKVVNANLYFMAFEFQLWDNVGRDTLQGQRERLQEDAMTEFTGHLQGITHWGPDEVDPLAGQSPLSLGEANQEKENFNAVAAALEQSNRQLTLNSAAANLQAMSMLNLIETALLAGKQIDEGKARISDFPTYVNVALQHREHLVRLLKARYQMLGLCVLTQFTKLGRSVTDSAKLVMLGEKWDFDFGAHTQSEIDFAAYRISQAIQARDTLIALGETVALDPTIAKIYSHAQIKNFSGANTVAEAAKLSAKAKSETALTTLLADYTKKLP